MNDVVLHPRLPFLVPLPLPFDRTQDVRVRVVEQEDVRTGGTGAVRAGQQFGTSAGGYFQRLHCDPATLSALASEGTKRGLRASILSRRPTVVPRIPQGASPSPSVPIQSHPVGAPKSPRATVDGAHGILERWERVKVTVDVRGIHPPRAGSNGIVPLFRNGALLGDVSPTPDQSPQLPPAAPRIDDSVPGVGLRPRVPLGAPPPKLLESPRPPAGIPLRQHRRVAQFSILLRHALVGGKSGVGRHASTARYQEVIRAAEE
mmetsp:Transcript_50335/g.151588  ORF Transcript_50335/g.151588 Transcript_50335/m.151588 type:complete len:261 (-) Transcript_50335:818-1600(-)